MAAVEVVLPHGIRGQMHLLTEDEFEVLDLTGKLAAQCRALISDGPNAAADWAEFVHYIHGLQHLVMAQAAARAYPSLLRPLGGSSISAIPS